MRCVIARYPFDLTKAGVEKSMEKVRPVPATGASVAIGDRVYCVKQVGQVVTGQDPRDFTAAEMVRALVRLGFTCRTAPPRPAAATDLSYGSVDRLLG
ncbi:SCO5918 family protein [Streptomyces sp. RG80]|uniref:SCO5918 family protein n=1 Tax=Streptomyces sp. RG80 TaxID=3157340 RepID=UPI00338E75FC